MPTSEAAVIAITSGTTICTIVLSRLRCLLRPCDPDGQYSVYYSQCGFTDAKLDKSAHELKIDERNLNGRDVLVVASND